MPVQRTFLGRSVPLSRRMPPRRIQLLLGVAVFFVVSILVFSIPSSLSRSAASSVEDLSNSAANHLPKGKLPKLPNLSDIHIPFRPVPAHTPPAQPNSTSGETKWYSDWKWLKPFSSSITLDENRSVLPPFRKRPPIYTFYDTSTKKDDATREAENQLLLVWRRAWWAQGFRPVVLGRAEAMNNPLYETLQTLELEPTLDLELTKWLAWGNMGTGILANWLVVPMGPYEDHLLTYLRRGEYPKLTRFEGLGSGLFTGDKAAIDDALKQALNNKELKMAKSLLEAAPRDMFDVDPDHDSIAFYDSTTITNRYQYIADKLANYGSEGLALLPQLINSHLHTTFQNSFSDGIAVLKPLPAHMTTLVEPAFQIATMLTQCPETPVVSSCPPNRPKCKPCASAHPLAVYTPKIFRNSSTLYTIGTVPHPYTMASLTAQRGNIDTRFVRRETVRDPWVTAATKELMGTGIGAAPRVIRFKEAVASEWGSAHSLWLTAEKESPQDLAWHFGFALPTKINDKGTSVTPVPGPERRPQPIVEGPVPTREELAQEQMLLEKARAAIKSTFRPQQVIKEVVEAWNLADTEAWRFARAFAARGRMERLKWEEEEKKFFAGTEGKGEGWGRWFDRGR
ncbi:MAG: hypothetical protein M1827_005077 [Pycnora praestabilis]|nr:MAG: hypothetical protein M1827_005077 [Pycnora praestabilis]